jgi:hypothetical protein
LTKATNLGEAIAILTTDFTIELDVLDDRNEFMLVTVVSINLPTIGTFDVKVEIATIAMVEEASFAICMLWLWRLEKEGVVWNHRVLALRMTCGGRRCSTEIICRQDRIPIYRTHPEQTTLFSPSFSKYSSTKIKGCSSWLKCWTAISRDFSRSPPFSLLHSPAHDRKVIN